MVSKMAIKMSVARAIEMNLKVAIKKPPPCSSNLSELHDTPDTIRFTTHRTFWERVVSYRIVRSPFPNHEFNILACCVILPELPLWHTGNLPVSYALLAPQDVLL